MQIYPAIDIKDGKCVRLRQGVFDDTTVYFENPADAAKNWQKAGASYLHVVDLDGAKSGGAANHEAIKKILAAVDLPVQVGGGIRNMAAVEEKLSMGVARIIIGTAAIQDTAFVSEAVKRYGERIAVGVDASNGMVAIKAWEEISGTDAVTLCLSMKELGVRTIIYTDISRDGMMTGPNIEATRALIEKTGLDIIASGGVSCVADLDHVRHINASGVIIGKALYLGAVDLKEAIEKYND